MFVFVTLIIVWLLLMLRTIVIEYKYYQSVMTLEPEIWRKLGSPKFLNIPVIFISAKGKNLLKTISNETVCELAKKHHQAGMQFLLYVILVLMMSIIYFKVS
ncbi:MAG: hypothetical protein WBC60_03245 [Cognaticolwellia sp.]